MSESLFEEPTPSILGSHVKAEGGTSHVRCKFEEDISEKTNLQGVERVKRTEIWESIVSITKPTST